MNSIEEQTQRTLVLAIDDDPLILESIQQILAVMGWNVLTAVDGEKGIALFDHHRDEIGVVLLDMSMPGMDGIETLQALRQIDGGVKVILLSGHDEREMARQLSQSDSTRFLQKPFNLSVLAEQVASAMVGNSQ